MTSMFTCFRPTPKHAHHKFENFRFRHMNLASSHSINALTPPHTCRLARLRQQAVLAACQAATRTRRRGTCGVPFIFPFLAFFPSMDSAFAWLVGWLLVCLLFVQWNTNKFRDFTGTMETFFNLNSQLHVVSVGERKLSRPAAARGRRDLS